MRSLLSLNIGSCHLLWSFVWVIFFSIVLEVFSERHIYSLPHIYTWEPLQLQLTVDWTSFELNGFLSGLSRRVLLINFLCSHIISPSLWNYSQKRTSKLVGISEYLRRGSAGKTKSAYQLLEFTQTVWRARATGSEEKESCPCRSLEFHYSAPVHMSGFFKGGYMQEF